MSSPYSRDNGLPSATNSPMNSTSGATNLQVEDHPTGYPRYAALIASHPSFQVFRRFTALRARMLLHRQDRISELELELRRLDTEEPKRLFLGNFRKDNNTARRELLAILDTALKEYDDLIERTRKALKRDNASTHSIGNLKNWLDDSACLARDETDYLSQAEDLMAIASTADDKIPSLLQRSIEDSIIWAAEVVGKSPKSDISRNPKVHIFSRALINSIAQVVLTFTLIVLLFLPILIISLLDGVGKRLGVILVALTAFLAIVSTVGQPKTADLCVAGATYATVLVIFVV